MEAAWPSGTVVCYITTRRLNPEDRNTKILNTCTGKATPI